MFTQEISSENIEPQSLNFLVANGFYFRNIPFVKRFGFSLQISYTQLSSTRDPIA